MNYVIGMCKKDDHWIDSLNKWKYEVQVIEQRIHTADGDYRVKPDIISASNVLLHALVFELKGGKTIETDQLERYSHLAPSDLSRWVTVFDKDHLRMDVCICDFEENHAAIKAMNTKFPMLTFGFSSLKKEGVFTVDKLNEAFKAPISFQGKLHPYSYYPFSEEDEQAYIAIHVIRSVLSILIKNYKTGKNVPLDVMQETFVSMDDIIATKFNYIWKVLSDEQKKTLKTKIAEITRRFFLQKNVSDTLGIIQNKEGYKVTRNLEAFQKLAIKFLEELETEKGQKSFDELNIF
jgi:hypothetical protein